MTTANKKPAVDYTLYLVTDSTPAILGEGRDLCAVVESALKGGVTIVQYRDKTSPTGALISTAKRLHQVTKKYNVPLLINDRIDVALAVGCEGVHVGQDDMDYATARRLLGPDAIIGVTASTEEEALRAADAGADYLGVGTVFSTSTKRDTKHTLYPSGLRTIMQSLAAKTTRRPGVVCIGGIGPLNVQRVLLQGSPAELPLDGVAVVSAIIGAEDPAAAAGQMLSLIKTPAFALNAEKVLEPMHLVGQVAKFVTAVGEKRPISHNMTNLVVQNFAANVALSIGASPIMSSYAAEAADLARLGGALVINAGTVTPEGLDNYIEAVQAYNVTNRPVVLDPVGAGATAVRRAALKTLLNAGYFTVIKGNAAEITEVFHAHSSSLSERAQQRGVDSAASRAQQPHELAQLVTKLASREKCVIVMTGATDYVSDGVTTVLIKNGDPMLGRVTGTGCTLGTTISAYLAVRDEAKGESVLAAVVAGILHYEVAGERAASKQLGGPGSFVPAFLDALAELASSPDDVGKRAKIEIWTQ